MSKCILNQIDVRMINYNINVYGHRGYLTKLIEAMNCIDRIMPNGQHIMQTIGFPYQHIKNQFDYTIDVALNDNVITPEQATSYWALYNKAHEANLQWEVLNPPIVYTKSVKGSSKAKAPRAVKAPKETNPNDKVEHTAAQFKAIKKSNKLSKLTFSLKTIKDDNVI